MNKTLIYHLIFMLLILTACQSNSSSDEKENTLEGTETNVEPSIKTNEAKEEIQKYEVIVDNLRFRKSPGTEGEVIANLKTGEQLTDLGEVSDFSTKVTLRGIEYNEAWIKVKRETDEEGWIFPGGIRFLNTSLNGVNQHLIDKRLIALFGNEIFDDIKDYRSQYLNASDSEAFAEAYKKGELLRETLVDLLEDVVVYDDNQTPQNLFWLNHALPGYITSLAAEGTRYYLFKDYKIMQQLTQKTTGKEDDEFVELNFYINQLDSVEYFYHVWFMQTWDYGGHSLLGKGHHFETLSKMEAIQKASSYFNKPLLNIKNKLIYDITAEHMTYWQKQKEIINELKRIQSADFSVLNKEDRVAIATRLKMFQDLEQSKIELNLRSGR